MSRKIICDRCRIKDGLPRKMETVFKIFNIDLCDDCNKLVIEQICLYESYRKSMDENFYNWIYNPQPGSLEAIMGKFGFNPGARA